MLEKVSRPSSPRVATNQRSEKKKYQKPRPFPKDWYKEEKPEPVFPRKHVTQRVDKQRAKLRESSHKGVRQQRKKPKRIVSASDYSKTPVYDAPRVTPSKPRTLNRAEYIQCNVEALLSSRADLRTVAEVETLLARYFDETRKGHLSAARGVRKELAEFLNRTQVSKLHGEGEWDQTLLARFLIEKARDL